MSDDLRTITEYPVESVGEELHHMMTDRGLFPYEASAVLESTKTKKGAGPLAEVLNKPWAGYPPQFHAAAWLTTRGLVVEYIEEFKPLHWAKGMFAHQLAAIKPEAAAPAEDQEGG